MGLQNGASHQVIKQEKSKLYIL